MQSIGSVCSSVGFGDFLTQVTLPLLGGKGKLLVCLALLLFGTAANLVMTPLAMLGGLSLPFAQTAVALGVSPVAACMILLFSCELVFFPYESSGNLIMYSYGLLPMKEFIKQFAVKDAFMVIGFIVVMYPMWSLFGLI